MSLQKFYLDKGMSKEVKEFLLNHLKEIAVTKAFSGLPVVGIGEAKQAIDSAFNQLENHFGEKKRLDPSSSE